MATSSGLAPPGASTPPDPQPAGQEARTGSPGDRAVRRAIISTSRRSPGSSYSWLASRHPLPERTHSRQAGVWKGRVEGSATATSAQMSGGTGVVTRTVRPFHRMSRPRRVPSTPPASGRSLLGAVIDQPSSRSLASMILLKPPLPAAGVSGRQEPAAGRPGRSHYMHIHHTMSRSSLDSILDQAGHLHGD
jgi:hypothetical protein